ncbi:hypothetical protein MBLNU459_g0396t1 [Dothideomycetes sp. NU459]
MASSNPPELTPLALTILGLDRSRPTAGVRQDEPEATAPPARAQPQLRVVERRSTAYHNAFQTKTTPSFDDPPSYSVSASMERMPRSARHLDGGKEILPKYTCSVAKEGVMSMRVEKLSPFQFVAKQEWRSVYVVLSGTLLNIYKIKNSTIAGTTVAGPGKLIRSYTLQHAEVGLAADTNYYVLVPQTKLAQFIPALARRKAFEKDPGMFKPVRQCVMRLRLETDQVLLAERSEQQVFSWIHKISAGIDIAPAIDERSPPKQCTVPRRRRRQRILVTQALTDRRLVEEQEQILRRLYPAFAEAAPATHDQQPDVTVIQPSEDVAQAQDVQNPTTSSTVEQESEDIDLAALAEDSSDVQAPASRPATTRQTSTSSVTSAPSLRGPYVTNSADLDMFGKWAPLHPSTAVQQWRYIRRCVPVLLYDSPRASDIIIYNGTRLYINSKMDMLEEWTLAPPSYDAHNFPSTSSLQRAFTRASVVDSVSLTPSASTSDGRPSPVSDSSDNELTINTVTTLAKSRSRASNTAQKKFRAATAAQDEQIVPSKNEERPSLDPNLVLLGF